MPSQTWWPPPSAPFFARLLVKCLFCQLPREGRAPDSKHVLSLNLQVYVMGPNAVLVRRASLVVGPNDSRLPRIGSIESIPRVSAHCAPGASCSEDVPNPPHWLVQGLANQLRQRLHLQLFNFDMIRPLVRLQCGAPRMKDLLDFG